MEKAPIYKSTTKLFELTNIDNLNEYTNYLNRVTNNPKKYVLIDNCLQLDLFGNPFVIFQVKENIDIDEKSKQEFSFFGQIISQVHLSDYDDLTNDHWSDKIRMTYCGDFYVKDKENPVYYKVVIYYKVNDSNILKSDEMKLYMPRRM